MWKIVLLLLAVTAAIMFGRLVVDPPVIETRAGAAEAPLQTTYAYAGLRG
jgi:hypothetical protein